MPTDSPETALGSFDPGTRMISVIDFQRLEKKMDGMSEAINKLVLVEERQTNQSISIVELRSIAEANRLAIEKSSDSTKNAIDRVEKKVDQWINRGIGIWLFVIGVSTVTGIILTFQRFSHA